jgi:hypothetical protein
MLEVACNCITKLLGEEKFRHIGDEIDCLFLEVDRPQGLGRGHRWFNQ